MSPEPAESTREPIGWDEDLRLLDAVEVGALETVRDLLAAGVSPHGSEHLPSPMDVAIDHKHLTVVRLLMERGVPLDKAFDHGQRRIHRAAATNDTWRLKVLLDFGMDPNATDDHGWTPLHSCATYGATETAASSSRPARTQALAHATTRLQPTWPKPTDAPGSADRVDALEVVDERVSADLEIVVRVQ